MHRYSDSLFMIPRYLTNFFSSHILQMDFCMAGMGSRADMIGKP